MENHIILKWIIISLTEKNFWSNEILSLWKLAELFIVKWFLACIYQPPLPLTHLKFLEITLFYQTEIYIPSLTEYSYFIEEQVIMNIINICICINDIIFLPTHTLRPSRRTIWRCWNSQRLNNNSMKLLRKIKLYKTGNINVSSI